MTSAQPPQSPDRCPVHIRALGQPHGSGPPFDHSYGSQREQDSAEDLRRVPCRGATRSARYLCPLVAERAPRSDHATPPSRHETDSFVPAVPLAGGRETPDQPQLTVAAQPALAAARSASISRAPLRVATVMPTATTVAANSSASSAAGVVGICSPR